ncbi:hypothetical protein WS7_07808 [Xanthomonas citri pv. malvacearum str. GSPB2388]|uniref:hypothetical protein n=1 Tax=Xanthomonas citri TaxID=346 RepID=UPI000297CBCA|nr:hypothetical protein [Xanthomonas citri]EKQ61823.1 hypothetical protein WS7_07808 [Xanthomonas citri pv. malvacearum str. GSPB2388]
MFGGFETDAQKHYEAADLPFSRKREATDLALLPQAGEGGAQRRMRALVASASRTRGASQSALKDQGQQPRRREIADRRRRTD